MPDNWVRIREGTVQEIRDDSFRATLKDLVDPNTPEEYGTFQKDEVDPDDLTLLRPGAVFYWVVGCRRKGADQNLFSGIRFRRAVWTAAEIEEIERDAERLANKYGGSG